METAVIIICLLLSAFFSGMEIAYVSANKIYLGVESKQVSFFSKVLTKLTEKPSQFITSMLVGNSIALVIYGYHMGNAIMRWLDPEIHIVYSVLLQIFISSIIILLTSEFIPKVFFQVYANRLIKALALPAYAFYVVFNKLSRGIIWIADFILMNVFNTRGDKQQAFFSTSELGNYIAEQMNGVDEQEEVDSEIQIFQNALEFSEVKARDIMTPRTEISAVEVNDTVEELRGLFIETGYSKMIVYQGSIDNIVGYVHSFDLFKKPLTVRAVMISIEHAPGAILIKELLSILSRKRKSMAVVLDEYGGTAGIVTVEDIIEELFGEIDDEHDDIEGHHEEDLGNGIYRFSARLDVEYLNEKYGLQIPETGSYSTLAGLVMHHTNGIPGEGEKLSFDAFDLVVEQATSKKIELVQYVPSPGK
jgi:CBS domain containing-hemolysin-like protein